MSKKKKISGECAYCGKPATTLDHVPPQGLFAKPRVGLIKVPACQECNNLASRDDEFLKRLSLTLGADRSQDAVQASQSVLRSLQYPEAQKMKEDLYGTIRPVQLPSSTGLSRLESSFKMTLDGERMGRIIRKVVRGLYFHVKGKRLPSKYLVETHVVGQEVPTAAFRENESHILAFPEIVVGDRAFTFRHIISPEDEFLSVWRLEFYGVTRYMGYTLLRDGSETTFVGLQDLPSSSATAPAP